MAGTSKNTEKAAPPTPAPAPAPAAELPSTGAISRFAKSFKAYGIGLGVVLAAAPIMTMGTNLIPAYASVRGTLSFFTTLLGLLTVAVLFGVRRRIGTCVFPTRRYLTTSEMLWRFVMSAGAPAALVLASLVSAGGYLATMDRSAERSALTFATNSDGRTLGSMLADETSLERVEALLFQDLAEPPQRVIGQNEAVEEGDTTKLVPRVQFQSEQGIADVLKYTPSFEIPSFAWIVLWYLLMFLGAVAAFVWFGIIEYVQQELGIPDADLLKEPYSIVASREFEIESVHDVASDWGIHFLITYDPKKTELIGEPKGPYCTTHDRSLVYRGIDGETKHHRWSCVYLENNKPKELHPVLLKYSSVSLAPLMRNAAANELAEIKGGS